MIVSIAICLISFIALVILIRRDRLSLGLPIAYLFALLLIHVPGAIAHVIGGDVLTETEFTQIGIQFTAIGAVCFVVGVVLAQRTCRGEPLEWFPWQPQFWWFCLLAGWFVTYGLSPLGRIPTLGAAIDKGGAVWMLGVALGLRDAVARSDLRRVGVWLGALAVYPVLMLLLGGFLSFGSTAVFIVLALLVVSTRTHWRTYVGIAVMTILLFHIFLSYFENRDDIRDAVWGGAEMATRVERATAIYKDFEWFDPANPGHLFALDQRLNQNYFVGLASTRIDAGTVDYLSGRSFWEGLISIVPRALWPDKPVYGGSPEIIREMTGFEMNDSTSFGVGNVMEFHINFGIPSLIGGFLVLGFMLGWLDRRAALAIATGRLRQSFLFFLPGAAMIHPNGSLVELTGGAAAGLLAAVGWGWAWYHWARWRGLERRIPLTPVEPDAVHVASR